MVRHNPLVRRPTTRAVVSHTGVKPDRLTARPRPRKGRSAPLGRTQRRHFKQSLSTGPAPQKSSQADTALLPVTELYLCTPSWYNPAMMETKASQQTLAAARMRRMRQRQRQGAFLVTLELEPDDLAALRVPSPDLAGQAIFRLIDRLKAAR